MRIVAWNILHGGGRRVAEVCLELAEWRPDVVLLSEFRRTRGGCIRGALADMGLPCQVPLTPPQARGNGLLLAARHPAEETVLGRDGVRLLGARLHGPDRPESGAAGLLLVGAHMPERGAGPRRADAWHSLVDLARTMVCEPALIVGDLNAGRRGPDGAGLTRADGVLMGRLESLGFVDLFRRQHGSAEAVSWRSHRGSGYRLDHALASPALACRVRAVRYESGCMERRVSDHAAVLVDLDPPAAA